MIKFGRLMWNAVVHQTLFPMTPAKLIEHLRGKRQPRIHLPIIQRDAVWRSQQICELWDSLMRGISIPSLVLQKVLIANDGAATKTGESVLEGDYWLLDGQQRATAIRIGFEETATHRLWLDLAWQDREYGRRFGFYLCSMARPWGDAPDLNGRPGAVRVREARKSAGISDGRFDFQIPLDQTWPVAAAAPIPFAPLLDWASHQIPDKNQLWNKVAEIIDALATIPKSEREKWCRQLPDRSHEYWHRLATGLQRVLKPLIAAVEADMGPDDLLEAFTRLNRNGTRLTDGELFFSALKKELPECNALVKEACSSERKAFGELNVLRAFTVLATEKTDETKLINSTTLNLELFKTINKTINTHGREAFQQSIKAYLAPSGTSQAAQLLDWAIKTLRYRGTRTDAGLPTVLLPRLGVRTWLPVLHWFECQGRSEASREKNRDRILRYVLANHFFADWTAGEDEPLRKLLWLVGEKIDFPTLAEIESEWSNLPRRDGKSVWLKRVNFPQPSATGFTPVLAPLSPDELTEYRRRVTARNKKLPNLDWFAWPADRSHDLLLWSQRAAMDQWFAAFLPQIALLGEIGRPWDIDHIVPNAFFMQQNAYPSSPEALKEALKSIDAALESGTFETFRDPRNFLGNKRAWLAGLNRSDQDAPIKDKFPQDPQKIEDYLVKSDWWNKHAVGKQDALTEASAIIFGLDEPWESTPEKKITNGKSNWDQPAMQAFLQAVLARENRLYKKLFEFLKPGFALDRFHNRV